MKVLIIASLSGSSRAAISTQIVEFGSQAEVNQCIKNLATANQNFDSHFVTGVQLTGGE